MNQDEWIKKFVDEAPPLTDEQVHKISRLLAPYAERREPVPNPPEKHITIDGQEISLSELKGFMEMLIDSPDPDQSAWGRELRDQLTKMEQLSQEQLDESSAMADAAHYAQAESQGK